MYRATAYDDASILVARTEILATLEGAFKKNNGENMLEKEPVSFASLYGGAVIEALDYELGNAIRNIKDPNTKAEKIRTINLVVKIRPNKERNLASFQFQASFKPVPAEALETSEILTPNEGE